MSPRPASSGRKSQYNFQAAVSGGTEIRVSKKSAREADVKVGRIRAAASMWGKRNGIKLTVSILRKELGGRVQIVGVTV